VKKKHTVIFGKSNNKMRTIQLSHAKKTEFKFLCEDIKLRDESYAQITPFHPKEYFQFYYNKIQSNKSTFEQVKL